MRRIWVLSLLTALVPAVTGCTTAIRTHAPAAGISRGYAYQLPVLAYEAEIKRVLTECPQGADQRLRFEITATAASRLAQGETVVVDYESLTNGMKTSDLVLKSHPNGMLKSINFQVDDRTADVVNEAVKAAVSVGKIAIGLPIGGAVAGGPATRPYLRCTDATAKKINALPGLRVRVKKAEEKSKAATKARDDYEADHPESPRSKPVSNEAARLAGLARTAAADLDAAKKEVTETLDALTLLSRPGLQIPAAGISQNDDLSGAKDGKVRANALVELFLPNSKTRSIRIPLTTQLQPDLATAEFTGYSAAEVVQLQQWLRLPAQTTVLSGLLAQLDQATVTIVATSLTSTLQPVSLAQDTGCESDTAECGVLYRSPAPGRVRICWVADEGAVVPAECASRLATDKIVLFSEERLVPQFGKLMALPFRNKPFEKNVLTAEFAEDGRIVEFGYKKPVAGVQAGLASLNTGLDGLTRIISYERGKDLRQLQERKAMNEALLAEQESGKKLTPSELSIVKEQTDLINAQIALSQAQLNAQPSQVTQMNNETTLIEAEIRRTKKLIELETARKDLKALTDTSATTE